MEMSKNLATAFVKAQAEMSGALKDSSNPFFKSKYADLASVAAAIRPAAASNGIGYIQVVHEKDSAAAVETIIVHESGETYACGIVSCPVLKADAQGFGSALTYARRYSLAAAFGVCPEDDDGNAATKAPPAKKLEPAKSILLDASPELLKSALDAANGGTEMYAAFWKSITGDQRLSIGSSAHADFKSIAGEVKAAA